MAEKDYKLYIRVSKDFYEKFEKWAVRLRMTRSQFGNVCVMAGLGQMIRAVAPEEAISPAMWAKILETVSVEQEKLDLLGLEAINEQENEISKG
jgi:hypothetical protein